MKWYMRILAVTLASCGWGFVVWEIFDYRHQRALANAVTWATISTVCAFITWMSTTFVEEMQ